MIGKTEEMKNVPKKIYLQVGDNDFDEWPPSDFDKCSEVTWCEDRQDESDIEYVLAEYTKRASQSPELINEILTKYHEWALSLPGMTFVKWDYEEVHPDKTKARMRKEFINFLNKNNQNETK